VVWFVGLGPSVCADTAVPGRVVAGTAAPVGLGAVGTVVVVEVAVVGIVVVVVEVEVEVGMKRRTNNVFFGIGFWAGA